MSVDASTTTVVFELKPWAESGPPPASLEAVKRSIKEGVILRVGRQVVKDGQVQTKQNEHGLDVWFISKVVSRHHAELWSKDGQLYIRDVGSSSGTFLNKMRLSPSGKGSRPYPLKDGDIIQFGVDYKGKSEDIFKSVNVKVQFADQWAQMRRKQGNPAKFQNALRTLLNATNPYAATSPVTQDDSATQQPQQPIECCICINGIAPYQALFISPCSHCFHYKCVSVILSQTTMFPCPMCRQVANLTASVSMDSLVDGTEVTQGTEGGIGSDSDMSVNVDEQGKAIPSTAVDPDMSVSLLDQSADNFNMTQTSPFALSHTDQLVVSHSDRLEASHTDQLVASQSMDPSYDNSTGQSTNNQPIPNQINTTQQRKPHVPQIATTQQQHQQQQQSGSRPDSAASATGVASATGSPDKKSLASKFTNLFQRKTPTSAAFSSSSGPNVVNMDVDEAQGTAENRVDRDED